jgi:hypothetical protein
MKEDKDPCWKNYKMVGTKKKGSKTVPNCVPKESRVGEAQLDELDRPSGKLYIIITTDNAGAPHVFGDFGSFPQDVMQKVSKRGTRDKSGAKTKLKIDFLFDDFRSTLQQLRTIFRDVDFIGAEAAEFIIKSSALRSDQGEDVKQLKDYIENGDDRRMKMYQAPENDEEEGEPTGGNMLRIDPETGAARRVVGVKPQTQMGGKSTEQPGMTTYRFKDPIFARRLRGMNLGFNIKGDTITVDQRQKDDLVSMLGDKFGQVFTGKELFKEGGEKYKIKSTGSDINPATGKRATYYISPSTGKKVYKAGVKKGDHESPNSGDVKKKVAEGFDSENNSWHVTDVDAVSETDFEVALQGPAGIKLNFVIRPVDFVETQRERYQIDTMDVRDLQSGKTMHWGSMQNLGKWEPIFDAIDEHFWNNRSLQAHLAKIIDYYTDAGEHGKNPDMMPDLGKRDPNGIAMSAKDFVATHNQADAAIKSAKKGMAEGGEANKVKSIGNDVNPATDERCDYYINPVTGEKVYCKPGQTVSKGDHVNPKTGKVTKKVTEAGFIDTTGWSGRAVQRLGHADDHGGDDSGPKVIAWWFYDVQPGQEEMASALSVKQTKSGKWAMKQYDKSGRSFTHRKGIADEKFGPGKQWVPKNKGMAEGGITLPNPDGSLPPGAHTVSGQERLNQMVAAQQRAAQAPRGLTPEQQKALAPYLKTDTDGSKYYDLPTTDPKEIDARMGATNTSPAALAKIKSPEGQKEIIQQLLAMADSKNAIPTATSTSTPVSDAEAQSLMKENENTELTRWLKIAGLR